MYMCVVRMFPSIMCSKVCMCVAVCVGGGGYMQCAGYCMQVYRWNVVITHNFMYYNYIVCTYIIIMSTCVLTSFLIIVETFL